MKARATAGAWRQDQASAGQALSLLLPQLGQCQGRQCPAVGAARHGRSLQALLHTPAPMRPRHHSQFPVARPALVCSRGPGRLIQAGPALSPLG